MKSYVVMTLVLSGTACLCAAQPYPSRAVRIVTSEAGGSVDVGARMVAQGLTAALGQQVYVENRPSGVIPGEVVAKSKPDGYTLLFFGGTFWLQPLLKANVPYDPIRDFAPISLVATSPALLVVHPTLPVKTVKDLVALAKARPGELNYAMGSAGSNNHLAAELFKSMTKVNMVGIPYKGNGPAVTGLISGQVQLMFATATSVIPHVQSGRMKALGVASVKPSALVPGVPTIASSGLSGYESVSTSALFAPAQTPEAVVKRLNEETVRLMNSPDGRERFLKAGAEPTSSTPEELSAVVKSEMTRIGKLIRDAGIRPE